MTAVAYCEQIGVPVNQFYKMSHKLGYTNGGERTEKWYTAARQASPASRGSRELVPVPAETVREAVPSPAHPAGGQPQIVIQYEKFRVAVGDDFSGPALQRVLEVIVNA